MNDEKNPHEDMLEETTAEETSDETPKEPPRSSGIALGLIVFILMALSLGLGVVAGPMVTDWFSGVETEQAQASDASGTMTSTVANDHSDHGEMLETSSGWYVCPMHPWVVQPEPGTCPICTMDLTPLDPERFSGEIVIDPVVLQNIGVRVRPVVSGVVRRDIRTVGTIAYDERRIVDVNLKVGGWIEKMYVDFEGARVRKGQKLLELYAPEIYSTQEEYLLLWRNREVPGNTGLLAAAKRRLELFDVTDKQIEELQSSGEVQRTLTIYAPANGFVIAKSVNEGQKAVPGNILVRIADLGSVWLLATVYEHQLPFVGLGREVEATLDYLPNQRFTGRIDYIYPTVDPATREVKVRMQVRNRDGLLKPGMFADVRIGQNENNGDELKTLAPREAVIDTGERRVAFVSLGDGRFEPRDVETGRDAESGMVEIIDGLQPGEQIVVSGQFLLDSESRIRESLVKMIKGDLASEQLPDLEFAAPNTTIEVPEDGQRHLAGVLEAYLGIQEMLYGNQVGNLAAPAATLLNELRALGDTPVPGNEHFWHTNEHFKSAIEHATSLAGQNQLDEARVTFGHFSHSFNELVAVTGLPESHAGLVMGLRCGMYEPAPRKGVWLQRIGDARNPFYGQGSGMASCNIEKWALPVGGADTTEESTAVSVANMKTRPQAAMNQASHGDTHAVSNETTTSIPAGRFTRMMDAYFAIHESLYADSLEGVERQVVTMLSAMEGIEFHNVASLRSAIQEVIAATELHAARVAFGHASVALAGTLEVAGVPKDYGAELVIKHCGMFPDAPEAGLWVQAAGKTRNPFFGQNHGMAACAPSEWKPGERKQE